MRLLFVAYLGWFALSAALASPAWAQNSLWAIVFGLYVTAGYWVWERRPAVWLVDQGDGTLAVHHRNVFFLPMTGQLLELLSPSKVCWSDGPWWRLGQLWIDGQRWQVLDDGQEAARILAERFNPAGEGNTKRAAGAGTPTGDT